MNRNNYALLIGINKYKDNMFNELKFAEKGCSDISGILSDKDNGIFLKKNIKLLRGSEATTKKIREFIYQITLKGGEQRDIVLFYYAGHGFIGGEQQNPYISTYDTNVNDLNNSPDEGISMDYLYKKMILEARARYVIIILDCCTSGSFAEKEGEGYFNSFDNFNKNQYIAILSCPSGESSFEKEEYKNSVLSYYLINGLNGDAVDSEIGAVSLDYLLKYLDFNIKSNNENIVLRKNGVSSEKIILSKVPASKSRDFININLYDASNCTLEHLKSTLDPYVEKITTIIDHFNKIEMIGLNKNKNILEAIIVAFGVDFASLILIKENQYLINTKLSKNSCEEENEKYCSFINQVAALLVSSKKIKRRYQGYYINNIKNDNPTKEDTTSNNFSLVINLPYDNEFLIVKGLSSNYCTDAFAFICKKLFVSIRENNNNNVSSIEARLYDELKKIYGFVPAKMLERRFSLFKDELQNCTTQFQPVIYLDPKPEFIKIISWEALARDTKGNLPKDLLEASELWGRKFRTELDAYFLNKAATNFYHACKEAGLSDIPPLSINVYADSLMSDDYYNALQDTFNEKRIIPGSVISLEISEKMPLPMENSSIESTKYFLDRLDKLVKDFHIAFAIDDFGIGHASISRLERLQLNYVKIDREISFHNFSEMTIRYVIDHVTKRLHGTGHIVLEGLDERVPLSVQAAYKSGIRYLQGYITGRPTFEVYHLNDDQKRKISQLITNPTAVN